MNSFTKMLIATVLLIGCGYSILAETTSNSKCGNSDEFKVFLSKFQEQIVFKGYNIRIGNGKTTTGLIIITLSNTGSWSMFEVSSPNQICLIDAGEGGASIDPETTVTL
jgi:hypothetical protein